MSQRAAAVIETLNSFMFGHATTSDPLKQHLSGDEDQRRQIWRNWSGVTWTAESASLRFIDENLGAERPGESFLRPSDLEYSEILLQLARLRSSNSSSEAHAEASLHEQEAYNATPTASATARDADTGADTAGYVVRGILQFPGSALTKYFAAAGLRTDSKHYGYPLYVVFLRALQGIMQEYMHSRAYHHHRQHDIIQSCLRDQCDPLHLKHIEAILEVCGAFQNYAHNSTIDSNRVFSQAHALLYSKKKMRR
jgi:hypothetical protein